MFVLVGNIIRKSKIIESVCTTYKSIRNCDFWWGTPKSPL